MTAALPGVLRWLRWLGTPARTAPRPAVPAARTAFRTGDPRRA